MTGWHRIRVARITALSLSFGWGFGWASAATMSPGPELTALPWVQIFVGAAISSWGGITATLGRYLAAEYDARPFHWRGEVIRDGAVSITVGAGAYMAGAWYGLSAMSIGLVLLLSGYVGVRMLSVAADQLLALVSQRPQ